ncbi:MAG: hypothetical protein HY681_09840 [Chloroflexi bacterium]|nr:hypothetical protein [Chloroflexota bacterium]
MYSQDGFGLGHYRRTCNIAEEILALEPGARILAVVDTPAVSSFPPVTGMERLKLPTIVKTGSKTWRCADSLSGIEDAVGLRSQMLLQAFCDFSPDMVVVDHMPTGALGELKPLLDRASQTRGRPKLFLGLRDILDAPEVIRSVWSQQGAYDYLQVYDSVLIYGCRSLYDAELAYRLTPGSQRVVYCNYVAPRDIPRSPDASPEKPFILVMGGGGWDAYSLGQSFMDAAPHLLRELDFRALVLTGPNMPFSQRQALESRAAGYPVQVQGSTQDTSPLLEQASAVVTMAGYNSLVEILQWRKKALVVPRAGPSAEQRMRSRLFAVHSLVRMLDPDDLTPRRLAAELARLLEADAVPNAAAIPPLDGAERAAGVLLACPGEARSKVPAA